MKKVKTLKTRFYEKNVVSAYPKLKEALNHSKKLVIRNILTLLLGTAALIIIWLKLSATFSFCLVPVILFLIFRLIANLRGYKKLYKTLSINLDDYSMWMELHLKKEYPNKSKDCQKAGKIFSEYYNKPEQAEKVHSMLTEELKVKPPFPLTISVLCGLLFLFDYKDARNIIFNAKYKHGAAGNMIYNMWIFYYDGQSELPREKIENDFIAFWTDKKDNSEV